MAPNPRLIVSSDLNGTLVHQHTMSDMIRIYLGAEKFAKAEPVFKRQTSGLATMEEAFGNAGPLTRGLTLRQAIEYTRTNMKYVDGFHEFVGELAQGEIPLIVNSTGYSVSIHAIRAQVGLDKIHGQIGNNLVFGMYGLDSIEINDQDLEGEIRKYFSDPSYATWPIYDCIQATGEVRLGIANEDAKAELLAAYVAQHFPGVQPRQLVHIGDTMGDSGGIVGVARMGGTGIAFNYNAPLETYLRERIATEPHLANRIHFVDPKGPNSDLRNVLPIILEK
ncbi:hypothetical protein HYV86_04690 [Candidatus Woesearchaeota archaeon]|nr:hypothetical protein [Candidatus Woesearchaeota archaeon]